MTSLDLPVASVAEPRARFRDLVASEWLKMWSLRSTGWSLLLGAIVVVAFNFGTAWDHYRYFLQYDEASRAEFVANDMALWDAFTYNAALVLILSSAAMGAVTVVGEYGSGLVRTTFTAVPARGALMAAKVLVVTVAQAAFGAVVAGASFWSTQAMLSARDIGLPITHPGAPRIVVASALLAPVCAVAGMAIGALLRRGANSIVAAVVLLLLLPAVLTDRRHLTAVLAHATPLHAWQRLADAGPPAEELFPWSAGGAWLVYALWTLGGAAVTVLAVRRRDQ
ncbi:ABC transporter permease [Streptomyces tanashiensis]|uniref:ABC transporter permease n=1 Tax=Streptomyces tanashiensis TaxID=67367 RepID=A0ABY6QPX0_9ACTN|nr:ABC transporter permease [Streptomyces tanashiensis]UZX19652.1 ABC transporter permease [Streptomyces tanashiensis]